MTGAVKLSQKSNQSPSGYFAEMTYFDPRLTPARPHLAAAHLRDKIESADYVESRLMQVVTGIADVRRAPAHDAPLDTRALFGEVVRFMRTTKAGAGSSSRGTVTSAISPWPRSQRGGAPTHRVIVNRTFVYPCPDLKLPTRRASPLGAAGCVRAIEGTFAPIGDNAFVFADHLKPFAGHEKDFVAVAERFLHTPYLWGGKSSLGIDCSGPVQISLDAAGIAAPRDNDLQENAIGSPTT